MLSGTFSTGNVAGPRVDAPSPQHSGTPASLVIEAAVAARLEATRTRRSMADLLATLRESAQAGFSDRGRVHPAEPGGAVRERLELEEIATMAASP